MNTPNNKRRKESIRKIEQAFTKLLLERELKEITVSDICKLTGLNRSTFYANFSDVYALADRQRKKLEDDFSAAFSNFSDTADMEKNGAAKMFTHIKEHQDLYRIYFKLGYDDKLSAFPYDAVRAQQDFNGRHIKYHIEFFRHGINAIIKMWLAGGCAESPQEMADILKQEYRGRFREDAL